MNKVGERRTYSAGDKLPESTGDKLQDLLGIMIQLSWGNLSDCTGVGIPPGNNLILRLPGMLIEECLYSAGEC